MDVTLNVGETRRFRLEGIGAGLPAGEAYDLSDAGLVSMAPDYDADMLAVTGLAEGGPAVVTGAAGGFVDELVITVAAAPPVLTGIRFVALD